MSLTRTKIAQAVVALVEITLVIAVIVLLLAMAVPTFLGARKRSQASQSSNDHQLKDSASKTGSSTEKRTVTSSARKN